MPAISAGTCITVLVRQGATAGLILSAFLAAGCHPRQASPSAAAAPASVPSRESAAATEKGPATAATELSRILVLVEQRRWAEARPALEAALAAWPDHAGLLNSLGWVEMETGNLEAAVAVFRRVIAVHPAISSANYNLAGALVALRRVEEADSVYRAILAVKPDAADAFGGRGWLLYNAGRFDEAEDSFREAARLDPAHAWNHLGLGMLSLREQRLEEAMASFRKAGELEPEDALLWMGIAQGAHHSGSHAEAAAAFERVNRIDPKRLAGTPGAKEMWEASRRGEHYTPPAQ